MIRAAIIGLGTWGQNLLLNNGIMWFDPEPGKPNSLAPDKRMLANYCPVVGVTDDGRQFALGASGGRKILGAVLQLSSFLMDHRMTLEQFGRLQAFAVTPCLLPTLSCPSWGRIRARKTASSGVDDIHDRNVLGEIDSRTDNSHELPLSTELMTHSYFPSRRFIAGRCNTRPTRNGEVIFHSLGLATICPAAFTNFLGRESCEHARFSGLRY